MAGEVTTPYPTIENLSVVWLIAGDDDVDGIVSVRFREQTVGSWREGLPLRRIPPGSAEGFSWQNQHAGSVFDLVPGTTYEIELALEDPDGGSITHTVTASTRPVPQIPADAVERAVDPSSFDTAASSAEPGQVLVLADGEYPGFTFDRDGTMERPIVLRAENPELAVITGEIRLDGRSHVFLEDLTIEGRVVLHDTESIVVRGCTIRTASSGIVAQLSGTANSYVCDNTVIGSTPWEDGTVGANGDNVGEGIQLAGPGNVICYNAVRGFRDAISTMEDAEAINQQSLDITNNDIEVGADDAIEADFTMGNVRILRNRISNSFVGISGQPTLGGPSYYVRNVMYNIAYSPFKLHRGSVGDVAFHNTVVKCGDAFACYAGVTWAQALFRDNLFIGGEGGGEYGGYGNGSGRTAHLPDADDTCDFDYDGYGSIGTGSFQGRIGEVTFSSLAEMQSTTSEAHAVEVDMAVFAEAIEFPASGPFPARSIPFLGLQDGSAAVDCGLPLPNINDGFLGLAPDLGAYEAGTQSPHYGPRSEGTQAVCGNQVREGVEECDDGNTRVGDGCSGTCMLEEVMVGSAGAAGGGNEPGETPTGGAAGAVPSANAGAGGTTGGGAGGMDAGRGTGGRDAEGGASGEGWDTIAHAGAVGSGALGGSSRGFEEGSGCGCTVPKRGSPCLLHAFAAFCFLLLLRSRRTRAGRRPMPIRGLGGGGAPACRRLTGGSQPPVGSFAGACAGAGRWMQRRDSMRALVVIGLLVAMHVACSRSHRPPEGDAAAGPARSGPQPYWNPDSVPANALSRSTPTPQDAEVAAARSTRAPDTGQASLVADHRAAAAFRDIPACWAEKAKREFRIAYEHTSHGSQITSGLGYLAQHQGQPYLVGDTSGALRLYDQVIRRHDPTAKDLGQTGWSAATMKYLEANPEINVVMWSWCGQVGSHRHDMSSHLFEPAKKIAEAHKVTFIYMTGHLDGRPDGNVAKANDIIREQVRTSGGVLYDFADIESHDPKGRFYPDESDQCAWCSAYCSQYPDECIDLPKCAHSHGFNCVQKAKAYWWLLARMAGWNGSRDHEC